MGVFLVIGVMLYSAGMCMLIRRGGNRLGRNRHQKGELSYSAIPVVIPYRVPIEWVDAYRTEQCG